MRRRTSPSGGEKGEGVKSPFALSGLLSYRRFLTTILEFQITVRNFQRLDDKEKLEIEEKDRVVKE